MIITILFMTIFAHASWNYKAVAFCEKYKTYGKVNGDLFCKSSGEFTKEKCPDDSGDNLRHGFDASKLCMKAVLDCYKHRKNSECFTARFGEYRNKTLESTVDDIAGTEGFAPYEVRVQYNGDYSNKYIWREK